jgi:hypothetical protein
MADVARLRGCARSTVTRACARGGPLHVAMIADRVDIAHPAAQAWLGDAAPRPGGDRLVGPALFAAMADCAEADVYRAIPAGLGEALDPDRMLLDITHPAALEFFAAHPIGKDGPTNGGWLAPAAVGDHINLKHPRARVFLARAWGRVPTEAELTA